MNYLFLFNYSNTDHSHGTNLNVVCVGLGNIHKTDSSIDPSVSYTVTRHPSRVCRVEVCTWDMTLCSSFPFSSMRSYSWKGPWGFRVAWHDETISLRGEEEKCGIQARVRVPAYGGMAHVGDSKLIGWGASNCTFSTRSAVVLETSLLDIACED